VWNFSEAARGLVIDTGAGANISGDAPLLDHQKRVLGELGPDFDITKEESLGSFSGINGPTLEAREEWNVPGFLGRKSGVSVYRTFAIPDCSLPPLLSLNSLKSGDGLLATRHDGLFMPTEKDSDIYTKFPLSYTGTHYVLPFDKADDEETDLYRILFIKVDEAGNPLDGQPRLWSEVEAAIPKMPKAEDWAAEDIHLARSESMNEPKEKKEGQVFAQRAEVWESKRPLGPPPEIDEERLKEERWDLWEVFDEKGTLTELATSRGLRTGPTLS